MIKPNFCPSTSFGWTAAKPLSAGAYYLRGFRRGELDSRPALVEVEIADGKLVCNLNAQNTDDGIAGWKQLSDLAPDFEWLGPLQIQGIERQAEQARRDGLYFGLLPDNLESHKGAWLMALERLIELEKPGVEGGPDDRGFWVHEQRAMVVMYDDLQRLMQLQPQHPGDSSSVSH